MWESGTHGDWCVLVVGSGNVDLWTVYQLAGRSDKRTAIWNEQSETQCSMPECSRYRMRDMVPPSTIVARMKR